MRTKSLRISDEDREQIATILMRRANEIAGFKSDHSGESYPKKPEGILIIPASVEYGLELEIKRIRELEKKIRPIKQENPEEI